MSLRKTELTPRFDREAWLKAAIEVLAQEGQAKLRVEELSRRLGVTRGSFYHHFKSRDEFVRALIDYWALAFTEEVNARIESLDKPAKDRLHILMQMIEQERLDRYDIAFRSWAAQDPSVAKEVKKVDEERYSLVRSMFAEMGFEGEELEERARIWLVFHIAQYTVNLPKPKNSEDAIRRRLDFFTAQSPIA